MAPLRVNCRGHFKMAQDCFGQASSAIRRGSWPSSCEREFSSINNHKFMLNPKSQSRKSASVGAMPPKRRCSRTTCSQKRLEDNATLAAAVLSTVHELGSKAVQARKLPRTKIANAKRARKAFGDAEEEEMPIPLYTDDYNQHRHS